MGLFGKKEPVKCTICGAETGTHNNPKHLAKDGIVCNECYVSAGFPASVSVSQIPISLLKEQIESDDGLSIVKRYQQGGGVQIKKKSFLDELADVHNERMSGNVKCPRCGSEQISADKKGYGVGKAVVGAAIAGPLGLAAGNIGAKKVRITCLKCGNHWMAGQG